MGLCECQAVERTELDAKRFLIALAPWVLFSLVAERVGADAVGVAALLACLGSLGLSVYGLRHGGLKIIDGAGVITFAAIANAGFVGGHRVDEFLVHFGRGGAALLLATPGRRSTAKAGPRPCWPRGASGSATPPAWPAPGRVRPSSDGRPTARWTAAGPLV